MEMTVRQMLSQKLIFGFHGTELFEKFESLIPEVTGYPASPVPSKYLQRS